MEDDRITWCARNFSIVRFCVKTKFKKVWTNEFQRIFDKIQNDGNHFSKIIVFSIFFFKLKIEIMNITEYKCSDLEKMPSMDVMNISWYSKIFT